MIALNDLKRAALADGDRLAEAAQRVLAGGWYVLGPEVAQFERMFAQYCGVDSVVGVGNGTDALELAMRALGLGSGDTIAMSANCGMYAAAAACAAGCVPLFCDVDERTMLIDARALAALSADAVKAIVVTHLYGLLADMPAILDIARQRGWFVIEDCAQAHGAVRDGRQAGSWGDLSAFSFYPTKNLGAAGDGGAVVSGNAEWSDRVRALRQYGWRDKYDVRMPGGRNSRLDEMQAAILSSRLPALDGNNARRRSIADRYRSALAGTTVAMQPADGQDHVHHLCVLRTDARDDLREHLRRSGIATDIHYPCPDHRQPVWRGRFEGLHLPVTERIAAQVLSVPCHPWLYDDEVEHIAHALATWTQ